MASRQSRRWRRNFLLTGGVALSLGVAACGGSSSGSTAKAVGDVGSVSAPPSTTAAPPVKIVLLYDATSNAAGAQKAVAPVAKAWVAATNAAGGVGGHPVQIEVRDTKGDPPTAQSIAQSVAKDASVVAVLLADASAESTYANVLSNAGLPVIGGIGYSPTVYGALPNVFGVTTTFPAVVDMQVLAAKQAGASRPGVAACAEVDACSAAVPLFQKAAAGAGLTFTSLVKFASTSTSFTAECLQFLKKKTDFIQISGSGPAVVRLYDDCVQQGFKGYFGASAGAVVPDLYKADPKLKLAGGLNGFPWWVDAAPVARYRSLLEAAGVTKDQYGQPGSTATWASLELFKKALDQTASSLPTAPSRADVVKAYGGIKNETLDGLLSQPTTYTAGKPAPPVPCFWLYTYSGGTFSGNYKPTCDNPS